MALGASPNRVLRLFICRGLTISIASAFGGVLAALAASRVLAGLLYGVSPSNPTVSADVAALLLAVASVACYLPSGRAARIAPLRALRHEDWRPPDISETVRRLDSIHEFAVYCHENGKRCAAGEVDLYGEPADKRHRKQNL